MRKILSFFIGSCRVRFCSPRPERLVNAVHRLNLPFWDLKMTDGEASFSILLPRQKHLLAFRETLSPSEEMTVEQNGLPALFWRYRRRIGFFAGFAIFVLSAILSTLVLWSVEVTGVTGDPEVWQAALAEVDLRPGRLLSGLDTDRLSRLFLLAHPEYSYAGIRLSGTRALVELREADRVDKSDPYAGTSNLVSSGSGRVVRCEVMAGEAQVKPGDLISKGNLLISGIRSRENGAFSPVRARGRVFAETEDVFEVTIPLCETEERFTGREEKRVSLFILGRCVFSQGEKSRFAASESQHFLEPLSVFGKEMPVLLKTLCFSETEEKMTERTVDIARDLAYDRYIAYKWDLINEGAEILSEKVALEEREKEVFLQVHLTLVRDLAQEAPFSLTTSGS